jgi:hypothetical protein
MVGGEAGLTIVPVGGWSVGASETWTKLATEGTPALFRINRR